ncbi:hypothetical protein EJB05_10848, partial [Eragrostis curvula]
MFGRIGTAEELSGVGFAGGWKLSKVRKVCKINREEAQHNEQVGGRAGQAQLPVRSPEVLRLRCRARRPRRAGAAAPEPQHGVEEAWRSWTPPVPQPGTESRNMAVMDPGSEFRFDGGFFANVKANRAALPSDAALMHDGEAARLVDELRKFLVAFARSVTRMGAISVLTGNDGEIRTNCRVVN